jgi:hypothetical protein
VPIFYPSVAANMTLRFDEALLTGKMPPPKTATDGADVLGGDSGPSAKGALMEGTGSRLTHVMALVPKTATIELPTFRQTPKFTLTFAFRDFPIDPRAIRAMRVELFIGTVSSESFKLGMRGVREGDGDRERLASQLVLEDKNMMLAGLVDSLTVEHGEKGSEVVMEGKGLSGMMLSAKVNADQLKKLDLNEPLDAVVRRLIRMDAQGDKIPVRTSDKDWPKGVPKVLAQEIITRINKGAEGNQAKMPMKGDTNQLAVWDVITQLCNLVGAVPYFVAHELWLRPALSIYQQQNAGYLNSPPTPFKGGKPRTLKMGNGAGAYAQDISFRKMVYGRNLSVLKFERKFGPTTVPTIRVVSVNTGSVERGKSRLLEATVPKESSKEARTTAVDPSGSSARTETLTIPVPGITDQTRLESIARQIYEEVGRGEMGGNASSKDLSSLGGDNEDADLIRLRPGDAIEFLVDSSGVSSVPAVVSELTNQAAQSPAEAVKAVAEKLGGRTDLAQVLVGASRGTFNKLQNTFRVNNVRYSWDIASGLGVDFDFHNYIQARYDLDGKAGESELGDFTASVGSSPGRGSA